MLITLHGILHYVKVRGQLHVSENLTLVKEPRYTSDTSLDGSRLDVATNGNITALLRI